MQSSVRAVEAYRRSRLIDSATVDNDKITSVYLLDEICELIRSSPADVVKEVAESIYKRLEHKSPIVKQKTLRLIKYSAGKSGAEFRREMQRQSGAVRNLSHYKGQPDSLKGDALNKAVRDTAHEAVTVIFSTKEKTSSTNDVSKRIQGFGSTNFDAFSEGKEKKTMLGEVMSFGSASIKQGLNRISNHYHRSSTGSSSHSLGSYQAPNLRRSISNRDNFDKDRNSYSESRPLYEYDDNSAGRHSVEYHSADVDVTTDTRDGVHGFANSVSESMQPNQAENLVDKVAALGGVRLQPSRDSIQAFLLEAEKLDPMFLHQALESKLQAHSWQVRLKVLCLLEAIFRQKNIEKFGIVASLFQDDPTVIAKCLEFPHATLKDKAKKVLSMIEIGSKEEREQAEDLELNKKPVPTANVKLPDLMDTTDPDSEKVQDLSFKVQADFFDLEQNSVVSEVAHNILGDETFGDMSLNISQHTNGISGDLLLGLDVEDDKVLDNQSLHPFNTDESSLFEGLKISTNEQPAVKPKDKSRSLVDLIDNLTTECRFPVQHQHETVPERMHQPSITTSSAENSLRPISLSISNATLRPPGPLFAQSHIPSFVASGALMSPLMYANPSISMPTGVVVVPSSNINMHHAFTQNNFEFPLTGPACNQQVMTGLPTASRPRMVIQQESVSNRLQSQYGFGTGYITGFTDGFDFTNNSAPRYTMGNTKKEETKAFDFISDHISAVRGIKK